MVSQGGSAWLTSSARVGETAALTVAALNETWPAQDVPSKILVHEMAQQKDDLVCELHFLHVEP